MLYMYVSIQVSGITKRKMVGKRDSIEVEKEQQIKEVRSTVAG